MTVTRSGQKCWRALQNILACPQMICNRWLTHATSTKNIHPGEILLEEFLRPMEISQTRLAQSIGVPPRRINEIVLGKRGITADTALRLAKVFGTSVQFWMGLQDEYELREAHQATKGQLEQMMPIAA